MVANSAANSGEYSSRYPGFTGLTDPLYGLFLTVKIVKVVVVQWRPRLMAWLLRSDGLRFRYGYASSSLALLLTICHVETERLPCHRDRSGDVCAACTTDAYACPAIGVSALQWLAPLLGRVQAIVESVYAAGRNILAILYVIMMVYKYRNLNLGLEYHFSFMLRLFLSI